MKPSLAIILRALTLSAIVLGLSAVAQNHTTDPSVAAKLGITVQQLHSLRAQFSFTNEQLLGLSQVRLQLMLEDLDHPGIAKHQGYQDFQMLRMRDEHGQIPPDGLMHALEQRHQVGSNPDLFPATPDPSLLMPESGTPGPTVAGVTSGGWTWLGPGNIGGRVRALVMHPALTNVFWCGGVDGGVWKSTNNGVSWYPLNDFMANLAISCMVMDPTNADILYAGTGEAMYNADAIRGAGIFKSIDGGTNWFQLSATANSSFQYVGRLAIDPNNGQILLAATRSGIWRSANGGTNWTQRLTTESLCIAFHPTDSTQAVASGYNGNTYYSTDGGQTWVSATGIPAVSGFVVDRIEVAYSRSNPTVVFASVDNNSGEVYRSSDGGRSYARRNTGNSFLGAQGWYDNVIWVDPTSTNVVIVGGIDLWRSTDGGTTLTRMSQWQSAPSSAHADHHTIVAAANYNGTTIRTVYFGNDGGVYRAADVYTVNLTSGWQELNNQLGITQFYGGAGNSNSGTIVGGTQDNGSLRYTTGGGTEGWTTMFGGDGGFSAADPTDPNYFYGEYVYLQIHRSANGGSSSSYIYTGITDAGSAANFIAPFILDPNNPNIMLGGGNSLWRSTNVKAATPPWSAIKASTGSHISAIAVALGNSDIIWVGHNSGDVYYTTNGTAASPTWYQRDLGTPNLPNRYCGRIAITPSNPNKVYVTFGGYNAGNVWRTTDSGVNWTDISGNLPAAPVNSLVIASSVTNTLYVGTDVGVFATDSDGTAWSTGNDGPANVAVDELFWLGNKLVVATHGRGMFSITPALGPANLVAAGSGVNGGNGNGVLDPNECDQLNLVVQNAGGAGATNITAVLSTITPGVTVMQPAAAYPTLASDTTGTNSAPFQISVSPSFLCGMPVILTLNLSYTGGSNALTYTLPSGGPGYAIVASSGASIVPGTVDIGNHGDDVVTTVSLPFTWTFYGQSVSNATLSSNGNLQFFSNDNTYNNICLPYGGFNYAICPLWEDLRTDATGSGIFTSISGVNPNRIFNVEWRANYFGSGATANFEVRLYENQSRFDILYGVINGTGSAATVGAQSDFGSAHTSFECNSGGLSNNLQLTFQVPCYDGGGVCAPPAVTANFSGNPTTGAVPLAVSFTNLSSGATNYFWDFGDGNLSTNASPTNTYSNPGMYSVSLTAVGPGGTNTLTRTSYIMVVAPGVSAAGTVAYYPTNYPLSILSGKRVGSVTMNLTGDTNLSMATVANGSYSFTGVPSGGSYTITPSKADDNPPFNNNGVDIGDLLAILEHYLGGTLLTSPYALLAADVNADGIIDLGDLIDVQAMALGISNSFPAGLWRFVPADYVFPDPANPWHAPSSRSYNNLGTNVTTGDFVAIKLGDVDNSWTQPVAALSLLAKDAQGSHGLVRGAAPGVVFGLRQQSARPGQRVSLGVRVSGFSQVRGAQFTLAWDPAVLRYEGTEDYGLKGLSAANFGAHLTESGRLTFVWYDPAVAGVTLADGTVLFTVNFEVIGKAGSVSAVAMVGSPTPQKVIADVGVVPFGAQDGSVIVVGPGVVVSKPDYANGAFRLSVATEQGRSYVLEYSDGLAPAKWTALPAVVGDGTVTLLVDPAATNQLRFYRVRVE